MVKLKMSQKYKKLPQENNTQFIIRVVKTERKAMRPADVLSVCDLRTWKNQAGNTPKDIHVQAYLGTACAEGKLCKWKQDTNGRNRMVYADLELMPAYAAAKAAEQESAPVDLREAIREAKEKSDKLAQAGYKRIAELNIERRTPIIKPSGVSSNILDVLSVYHGKTVEQIEDIIMSKIRTARVDNKTLKRVSLFSVLKEMVE
tara:strand:- start:6 stop:614 length:609 start_codon:yes stop_codon:yes gene_type:complete